jgi:ureidoglycolate lyase
MMAQIDPEPLTKEAFSAFGEVIDLPTAAGRTYYEEALGNLRPTARPSLSVSQREPTLERPITASLLERHEFSSQTFLPLDVDRWLVVVAPHSKAGGPDPGGLRAFIANGRQGVTYRANTWHHGLTVLDRPGRFGVFMWRDGTKGDEEFVPIEPFTIRIP